MKHYYFLAKVPNNVGRIITIKLEAGTATILDNGAKFPLTFKHLCGLVAANPGSTLTRRESDIIDRWKITDKNGAARYFDTPEEAAAAADGSRVRRVLMKPDRTVTAWGYLRRGEARRESYAGRYGLGYIDHHETREAVPGRSLCSNRYHYATYYVEL